MRKNILLPTDFSDNAWSAAVYALKLFADLECTFFYLHTTNISVSVMSNMSNKLNRIMEDNAMIELKSLIKQSEGTDANPNHDFNFIISDQNLKDAIDKAILIKDIDLVVMGTKGATPSQQFFYGSNTVSIVNKITYCPLLIIPDEYDFMKIEQVAFATDFRRPFNNREFEILKEILELYNAKVRILHIKNEDEELTELQKHNKVSLTEILLDFEHSFHVMPKYTKKAIEINEFIEELGIDFLALKTYKHNIIESVSKEPIIKKLGFNPHVPILIITE